jgi:hypothetical protein
MSDSNVVKRVLVDPDHESYKNFFTTEQGQSLYSRKREDLNELIDDLAFVWRSAAYAAAMPGQISGQVPNFVSGWHTMPQHAESQLSISEMVLGILVKRLPTVTADPAFLAELRTTILDVLDEVATIRAKHSLAISEEDIWKQFLIIPEFQFYIISSQRFCYLTAYAAYESFVVGIVRRSLKDDQIRSTDKNPKFYNRLKEAVGESMASKCWSSTPVDIAREIRHSLMHERGRMTKNTEPFRKQIRLVEEEIQIHPSDNRQLFVDLIERVHLLLDAAPKV